MRSRSPEHLARATLILALVVAGCARESPEVHEARKAAQDYFRALGQGNEKEIADRSTCLVPTQYFKGARVLSVEGVRKVRAGAIDSLAKAEALAQREAETLWAHAGASTSDSLYKVARLRSFRASVYRCAARATRLSAPLALFHSDSTLETRYVRARFRYGGGEVGPGHTDREMLVRMLRVSGGKWIVFSVYSREDDPIPEML